MFQQELSMDIVLYQRLTMGDFVTGVYDNEFESGWKGWKPVTKSRYAKWQLQSGPSKFWGTGPMADHTTGKGVLN